jgi:formate hydrogenlyase subunit 3/multisubunit Na+/H+ antiporter MnhD subunit
MALVMTTTYSVFQTDTDFTAAPKPKRRPLRAFGFAGRVVEGTGIVAFSLFVALLTLTTAARADTLLADVNATTGPLVGVVLIAIFAVMLAMVRQTWRQTAKGIENAPRRLHRVG